MIKKAANYIMSFLLLISLTGISINKHYSGNQLYSVSVFSEPDSCCDDEDDCDCCTETNDLFQITDVILQSVIHFVYDVKIINLTTRFNDFEAKFFSKESTSTVFKFYKYLKHLRQNTSAKLQCFRL